MLVVCPSCAALNRVAPERLGDDPVCGKCGAAILDSKPRTLDDARFTLFEEKRDLPVIIIVDFWADVVRSVPGDGAFSSRPPRAS